MFLWPAELLFTSLDFYPLFNSTWHHLNCGYPGSQTSLPILAIITSITTIMIISALFPLFLSLRVDKCSLSNARDRYSRRFNWSWLLPFLCEASSLCWLSGHSVSQSATLCGTKLRGNKRPSVFACSKLSPDDRHHEKSHQLRSWMCSRSAWLRFGSTGLGR